MKEFHLDKASLQRLDQTLDIASSFKGSDLHSRAGIPDGDELLHQVSLKPGHGGSLMLNEQQKKKL